MPQVAQPWEGGRLRRAMYLATLVCPTSMPSLSSSPWIRGAPHSGAHVTDQPAYLRRHLWPSPAGSRFPAPIGSEPCPVPTDHGIRPDDRQRAANIGEQPIKADQYQSVDAAEEKPLWRGPPQGIDLLAQHQDLRLKLCSRSEQVDEHPPDQSAKAPHQATTSPDSPSSASRMRFTTGTGKIRSLAVLL